MLTLSLATKIHEHAAARTAHAELDANVRETKEAHARELAAADESRSALTSDYEAKINE
jgi:hypothetical protein